MDIEVSDVSEKKLLALPSVFADVHSLSYLNREI